MTHNKAAMSCHVNWATRGNGGGGRIFTSFQKLLKRVSLFDQVCPIASKLVQIVTLNCLLSLQCSISAKKVNNSGH